MRRTIVRNSSFDSGQWFRRAIRTFDRRVGKTTLPSIHLSAARSSHTKSSRGSVLLLVVVIVAMLTLAAYNFAQTMTTELEATSMYILDVQARCTADSGVDFVASLLGSRTIMAENLIHNPQLFMGRVVSASTRSKLNSRFTIISPVEHDSKLNAIRYGLMDESAKLNLNYLPNMGLSHDDLNTLLMKIPNVTIEIADALLDWMDTDDTKNPYGAESETYEQMSPPYKAKNGPFETIDELLLVNGITPTLLYGEDANRNGLLDPNENDGDISPPLDNADGVLDHGFVAYFTVHGRESNRKKDGTLKINVNDGFLTDLYDALVEAFDEETAKFVIAYRISGPATPVPTSQTNPVVASTSSSSSSSSTSSTSTSTTTSPPSQSIQDKEAAESLTDFLASVTKSGGTVTRGGIDLSKGGKTNIESIWSLLGSSAKVQVNGASETLKSPWSDDPSSIAAILPDLLEKLTTTKDEFLEGRININQARREVLLGLPTMTEDLVNQIVAAQHLDANGQPSIETLKQHNTTAWLFAESIIDKAGMISLDPYITAHGDVYRVQVLGFYDGGGPVSRIEAMVDGTKLPPRVTAQRDLNELGRGYTRAQLLQVVK
jgi:DNA uptake protein ComE-like DNA-binding protein